MAIPRIRRAWLMPMVTSALVAVVVAAGAAAAFETDTVPTYWRGLWWAISLITTVGFVGQPPLTGAGQALSVALMVVGFMLLAMVSASLAALFVRDEEKPVQTREALHDERVLETLVAIEERLAALEARLDAVSPGTRGAWPTASPASSTAAAPSTTSTTSTPPGTPSRTPQHAPPLDAYEPWDG
jgi:hypothetical protein